MEHDRQSNFDRMSVLISKFFGHMATPSPPPAGLRSFLPDSDSGARECAFDFTNTQTDVQVMGVMLAVNGVTMKEHLNYKPALACIREFDEVTLGELAHKPEQVVFKVVNGNGVVCPYPQEQFVSMTVADIVQSANNKCDNVGNG